MAYAGPAAAQRRIDPQRHPMKAMVLHEIGKPLQLEEVPNPVPAKGQLLIRIHTCGVCRTDLHIIDGDLPTPQLPLIPGHQIVGTVEKSRANQSRFKEGDRIGIPWLAQTCDTCKFCQSNRENLCDHAKFTGYTHQGGYAELATADPRYCLPIPDKFDDASAAPLLCAGLIGYRALRIAGEGKRLGLYGFGASAHIVCQVATQRGQEVYAFVRPGDDEGAAFARRLGAVWAGPSDQPSPEPLDAAIVFAPVGALMPLALKATDKGGTVVSAGIHMSDIPSFPYRILWEERTLTSVANLTRRDGDEFMEFAASIEITTSIREFPLDRANDSLSAVRKGELDGAAVLRILDAS